MHVIAKDGTIFVLELANEFEREVVHQPTSRHLSLILMRSEHGRIFSQQHCYEGMKMETKLTIKLSEDLRRRAKAVAALRGETLSQLVRAALEGFIVQALEEEEDLRAVQAIEERIAAGKERIYSHEEVWAEIEALESQGALPD